jgi:hypothetical protein
MCRSSPDNAPDSATSISVAVQAEDVPERIHELTDHAAGAERERSPVRPTASRDQLLTLCLHGAGGPVDDWAAVAEFRPSSAGWKPISMPSVSNQQKPPSSTWMSPRHARLFAHHRRVCLGLRCEDHYLSDDARTGFEIGHAAIPTLARAAALEGPAAAARSDAVPAHRPKRAPPWPGFLHIHLTLLPNSAHAEVLGLGIGQES